MSDHHQSTDYPLIEQAQSCAALMQQFPQHTETIRGLHDYGFAVIEPGFQSADIENAARFCADLPENQDRCQDAWMVNSAVEALATNHFIIELLSGLYGRAAFPFQTLNFAYGSQQAAHSDTYHFNSRPHGFMCGVWVALEDVQPQAGPLFYIPGSHKWPILERADLYGAQSYQEYEQQIAARIEKHGLERQTALLKKGQALIWTANLVHGGAPRQNQLLTRYSQVTHYYFENCAYYSPVSYDLEQDKHYIREPFDIAGNRFVASNKTLLPGSTPWRDRWHARRQVFKANLRRRRRRDGLRRK